MLDRGLRRSFPAPGGGRGRGRGARADDAARAATCASWPPSPSTPTTPRTSTTPSPPSACDGDAIRLWVHIADVSAYVRPGGAIDTEAYRRGTSVYVPGAVEPMLPEALSNRACSLRPGEDKLAVTVEMDMAGTDVRRVEFTRSMIRSRRAADLRRGRRGVRRARAGPRSRGASRSRPRARWRAALRARREERGALEVNSQEPRVRVRLRRPRDRRAPRGADRVAHADRGADDPRQRAGGRLPGRPQAARALPRAREARPAGGGDDGGPAGLARHPHAGAAAAT